MLFLLSGFAVLAATAIAFFSLLPRDGKFHRFVGTEAEPYIGVAITAGVALSFTMLLSGALALLGSP